MKSVKLLLLLLLQLTGSSYGSSPRMINEVWVLLADMSNLTTCGHKKDNYSTPKQFDLWPGNRVWGERHKKKNNRELIWMLMPTNATVKLQSRGGQSINCHMNRELKSQMSKKSRVNEYNDYKNQAILNHVVWSVTPRKWIWMSPPQNEVIYAVWQPFFHWNSFCGLRSNFMHSLSLCIIMIADVGQRHLSFHIKNWIEISLSPAIHSF